MRLFIQDPKITNLEKILSFINLGGSKEVTLKDFASSIREFLPHTQKYLKDYYTAKFRDFIKDAHILKFFDSEVLKEDAVLLAMKQSEVASKEVVKLYSTQKNGLSFHVIERKLLGYTGPWLMLIEHYEKNK